MRYKRLIFASVVLFVVAIIWNGVLHQILLKELDSLVLPLRRTDFQELMGLGVLMTLGLTTLFSYGYTRFAMTGTRVEGIVYGIYFALLAGLLVDLNQYLLYPIPAKVAVSWFFGGLCEFVLYGILITWLYPIKR